jgi:hypothetical protein
MSLPLAVKSHQRTRLHLEVICFKGSLSVTTKAPDLEKMAVQIARGVVVMRAESVDQTTSRLSDRSHHQWRIGETDGVDRVTIVESVTATRRHQDAR